MEESNMLLKGKFPFALHLDNPTGDQHLFAKIHPPEDPPTQTGEILVSLLTVKGEEHRWEIVRVTELGFEYKSTEDPACPDEWQAWVDLSTFSHNRPNQNETT